MVIGENMTSCELVTMSQRIYTLSKSFFLSLSLLFILSGCDDDEKIPGKLVLAFNHVIEGEPVVYNQLQYVNAAGNHYEVKEVQWFISDVSLVTESGKNIPLQEDGFAHYIDTNIPGTENWVLPDEIPRGKYTAIRFTFGLKGEKNTPGHFPDLPESNMIWPFALGGENGGYHYMKLNGFWINPQEQRTPFNFHIGVGQLYNSNNEVTEFVQNWFEVSLPVSFQIDNGETQEIEILMHVDRWFSNPHMYDHNTYGGMIMKNQEAMGKIKDNGIDVFSLKEIR